MRILKSVFFLSLLIMCFLGATFIFVNQVHAKAAPRHQQNAACWCDNSPTMCSGQDQNCTPDGDGCEYHDCRE